MSDYLNHKKMDGPARLHALADFLENDPRVDGDTFDMNKWGDWYPRDNGGAGDVKPGVLARLWDYMKGRPKSAAVDMKWQEDFDQSLECGTAACACGWATAIFEPLKLFVDINLMEESTAAVHCSVDNQSVEFSLDDGSKDPEWRPQGTTAACQFFGINDEAADQLFAGTSEYRRNAEGREPGCAVTPKMVATRLREYANNFAEHSNEETPWEYSGA